MSKKKYTLYANTGVTYEGNFYPAKSTFEVSEEIYKELLKTRFFRHKVLTDLTPKEEKEKKEEKQD